MASDRALGNDGTTPSDAAGDGSATVSSDAPVDGSGAAMPTAIADTYLQGFGNGPFGSAMGLDIGRSQSGGNNLFALYQFDLTGYSSPVTSATLVLYQYASAGTSAMTIEVHRVTQTWDEATATWANASTGTAWTSGGGGTYDSVVTAMVSITPGVYQAYTWDITALVNDWIANTVPNDGLELVYAVQPPVGNFVTFASRENTTTAQRPQLVIVP